MWRAGSTCELELELELELERERGLERERELELELERANEFRLLTVWCAVRREKEGDVMNGTRVDCHGAVGCWVKVLSGCEGGRGRMGKGDLTIR